jgi:hypothetical protein
MNLPFSLGTIPLPDWLPGWVPVVLLIPVVLWLLLALAVPFAVLGTRARLEGIEAQLDDLHAELRNMTQRFGPLPPPPDRPRAEPQRPSAPARARGMRAEPRIDWPRSADD